MPSNPKIDARHPDYVKWLPDWTIIRDCLGGPRQIKQATQDYLPMPNSTDTSDENLARYEDYLQRAVFLEVTLETQKNLVGQAFAVSPVFSGPPELEALLDSIDGGGVSAQQQAKWLTGVTLAYSRGGAFTDYPKVDGPVSRLDEEERGLRPRTVVYSPFEIINWDYVTVGAQKKLSFVMLEETYVETSEDGYEKTNEIQWRELRLNEAGFYEVTVWRRDTKTAFYQHIETHSPVDDNERPLTEIPFEITGALQNNGTVERPLLLSIALLNVAHYRNSADYEEAVFVIGQPTLVTPGMTQQWLEDVLENRIQLGSRGGFPLPEGASAELLQVAPNTMAKEAMDQKENQMKMLGAKLVERSEVERTATESRQDESSRASALASVVHNVSSAYKKLFGWAALFMGVENKGEGFEEGTTYEISTSFAVPGLTPEERSAIREDYNARLISFEEARDALKKSGAAYQDDDDVRDEHEAQVEKDFERAQRAFENSSEDDPEE